MSEAERAGLIRAILEDPYDNVPRMIFADWCDDNGDPDRANFIRYQLSGDEVRAKRILYTKRHKKNRNCLRWLDGRIPSCTELFNVRNQLGMNFKATMKTKVNCWIEDITCTYIRGFVDMIQCPLCVFNGHEAKELFEKYPITSVDLRRVNPVRHHQDNVWVFLKNLNEEELYTSWGPYYSHLIPPWLFDALDVPVDYTKETIPPNTPCKSFDSVFEGLNSVSNACVKVGRELAGLPNLKEIT